MKNEHLQKQLKGAQSMRIKNLLDELIFEIVSSGDFELLEPLRKLLMKDEKSLKEALNSIHQGYLDEILIPDHTCVTDGFIGYEEEEDLVLSLLKELADTKV